MIQTLIPKTISRNFPLKKLTTIKVGGTAKWFFIVRNEGDLVAAINWANKKKVKWYVIGEGSNLVPKDTRFNGLIIKNEIKGVRKIGNNVFVGSGESFTKFIFKLNKLGLSGMEKMAGIPGTIGGAIYGCAGAYGQEIKDCLIGAKVFNNGKIYWLSKKQCRFNYRGSIFKKKHSLVVLEANFKFKKDKSKILQKISKDIIKTREKKYRPGLLCPGSFFKNVLVQNIKPTSLRQNFLNKIAKEKIIFGKIPAGFLLESVGAKGVEIGKIKVANHHGNLIYNSGDGTVRDIAKLSKILKLRVRKKFGIRLEEEVQYL